MCQGRTAPGETEEDTRREDRYSPARRRCGPGESQQKRWEQDGEAVPGGVLALALRPGVGLLGGRGQRWWGRSSVLRTRRWCR